MAEKKKILLIDDEEDFCFFVKKNLELSGEFDVMAVTDGNEGVIAAQNAKPDLILLDILMPKISGPDVAERLHADTGTKGIPLIFLTAVVTKEEIGLQTIKEIGGYNYIAKPVDTKNLISSMRMILYGIAPVSS